MAQRRVWRLITHHSDPKSLLTWSLSRGLIALGWNEIGDVRRYRSPEEIVAAVRRAYSQNRNAPFSGGQLWNFAHKMKVGDLVILSTGKRREVVMEVTGEYRHTGESFEGDRYYSHVRAAKPVQICAERLWKAAGGPELADGNSMRWPFVECRATVHPTSL